MIAKQALPSAHARGLSRVIASGFLTAYLVTSAACASAPRPSGVVVEAAASDRTRIAIEAVLDDFHAAASEADGERYFAHQAAGSVFLGTDATERWEREDFRAYATPFFSTGRGWSYHHLERHIYIGAGGDTAWFDERLINEKYGETRGTGVLVLGDGVWRLAQYNLTIPVPNDLALDLVTRIRAHEAEASEPPGTR